MIVAALMIGARPKVVLAPENRLLQEADPKTLLAVEVAVI